MILASPSMLPALSVAAVQHAGAAGALSHMIAAPRLCTRCRLRHGHVRAQRLRQTLPPILFRQPTDASITIATTKLSFIRGRFAPAAWSPWRELFHSLAPWAEAVELEWEAAVHPAFAKQEHLPANAHAQASMTGVEWLRGRSGLLPGPRQLARISEFLDPRWVDTGSELSNCSYGECKARLWQPEGEQGDGRGGILEGYTNLIQADGAQYQVLEFRADLHASRRWHLPVRSQPGTHDR